MVSLSVGPAQDNFDILIVSPVAVWVLNVCDQLKPIVLPHLKAAGTMARR